MPVPKAEFIWYCAKKLKMSKVTVRYLDHPNKQSCYPINTATVGALGTEKKNDRNKLLR